MLARNHPEGYVGQVFEHVDMVATSFMAFSV